MPHLPQPTACLSQFIHTHIYPWWLPYCPTILLMSSLQVHPSSSWLCANHNQWIFSDGYNWSHIHATANLQPLYHVITVYASMYICVFIAYEWMSQHVCTYAHFQWAGNTLSEFFPKYYNINTYKIEHCYTPLLPVSSVVQAQIRYQKGEKMDMSILWGCMLCLCIYTYWNWHDKSVSMDNSSTAWCQWDFGSIVDSGRRW